MACLHFSLSIFFLSSLTFPLGNGVLYNSPIILLAVILQPAVGFVLFSFVLLLLFFVLWVCCFSFDIGSISVLVSIVVYPLWIIIHQVVFSPYHIKAGDLPTHPNNSNRNGYFLLLVKCSIIWIIIPWSFLVLKASVVTATKIDCHIDCHRWYCWSVSKSFQIFQFHELKEICYFCCIVCETILWPKCTWKRAATNLETKLDKIRTV